MTQVLTHPTWAEINLDNLKHNYKVMQKLCDTSDIACVVKANAYGHGAVEVATCLEKLGTKYFSVSSLSEALELRRSGIKCGIMLLTEVQNGAEELAVKEDVESTVFSLRKAKEIDKAAKKLGKIANIHIKLDTGMRRIGFLPTDESVEEIAKIESLENINLRGVFTHFAAADEANNNYTVVQFKTFKTMIEKLSVKGVKFDIKHVDNDAALLMYHYREDMVRLGIGLYGIYPSEFVRASASSELKPVMTLKSQVTNVKTIKRGDTVGYGQTYTALDEAKIATVGIGYADGLQRAMSNRGSLQIRGKKCHIVGRVCMDQVMVDVSDLDKVEIGDEVVFFGDPEKNQIEVGTVASTCGTISYEIISSINRRVPRIYIEDGKVKKIVNYLY